MSYMEQQKLLALLQELHQELEKTETVDEKTGEVLANLKDDIGKLVREEATIEEEQEGLSRNLSEALDHFEEEHPKISMAIQYVLDSLARMGL